MVGDIIFVRSHTLLGKLIRLIISVRYGVPFKKAFSHVQSVYDGTDCISAEPKGCKIVHINLLEGYDLLTYRIKGISPLVFKSEANKYIGKPYSYPRYAIDAIRIICFVIGLLLLPIGVISFFIGNWVWFLGFFGFGLGLTLLKPGLLRSDKVSYDCTELQSSIFSGIGAWVPPAGMPRNEYPDGMIQVLDNLCLHGKAERLET